jgi:hypothetical protein
MIFSGSSPNTIGPPMLQPRFDFYEQVRISTADVGKTHLNGRCGVVLGRTETERGDSWYYAVDVDEEVEVWCFYEQELEATGRRFAREDFYELIHREGQAQHLRATPYHRILREANLERADARYYRISLGDHNLDALVEWNELLTEWGIISVVLRPRIRRAAQRRTRPAAQGRKGVRDMTIERLSELYLNGYYSKVDFYLGLIDVFSRTDDPDHVMEKVPGTLLNEVCEMAERHHSSAGEKSDHKQQENPDKILRWVRRHRHDRADFDVLISQYRKQLTAGGTDVG